jgi:hypothetical protein
MKRYLNIPNTLLLLTGSAVVALSGCHSAASAAADPDARISGTYIAHEDTVTAMFQLVQTDHGQISGTFSFVHLNSQGKVESAQEVISGAVDRGQLTLTGEGGGSGAVRNGAIEMVNIGREGTVAHVTYARSSTDKFKAYSEQLQAKALTAQTNSTLGSAAAEADKLTRNIDAWESGMRTHAGRVENIKAEYRAIEEKMSMLLRSIPSTPDARKPLVDIGVAQANVAGSQIDVQSSGVWNEIIGSADRLSTSLGKMADYCRVEDSTWKAASPNALEAYHATCAKFLGKKAEFDATRGEAKKAADELAGIQAGARKRRAWMLTLAKARQ